MQVGLVRLIKVAWAETHCQVPSILPRRQSSFRAAWWLAAFAPLSAEDACDHGELAVGVMLKSSQTSCFRRRGIVFYT